MKQPVVKCILIEDCLAQKRFGKTVSKKPFRRGQTVHGIVTNIALTPDSQVLALKTKEGYVIPEPFLNIIGAVKSESKSKPSSDIYEDVDYEEVKEESSGTKSVNEIAKAFKKTDFIKGNAIRSKYVINFAIGGAALAFLYAVSKGTNKLVYAGLGAIGGGIVGNYVGNKIKQYETSGTENT